jgi:hypothetical protein
MSRYEDGLKLMEESAEPYFMDFENKVETAEGKIV